MVMHCRRDQRGLVAAALREIFNAEGYEQARERVTHVLERLKDVAPKVCELLEAAEEDLIAFYSFPPEHWTKLRSTNPLERVNKEIGRRADVVGIFPNDGAVIRLVGALLSEQNDEWLVQRRYLSVESMALILAEPTDPEPARPDRRCQVSPPPEPPTGTIPRSWLSTSVPRTGRNAGRSLRWCRRPQRGPPAVMQKLPIERESGNRGRRCTPHMQFMPRPP